jgi:hypothetical protein
MPDDRPREEAGRKASPRFAVVRGESEPLEAGGQGHGTRYALLDLDPLRRLARSGPGDREVIDPGQKPRSCEGEIELIVCEAVGPVEERAAGARGPSLPRVRVARKPGAVRRSAAEGGRSRVAKLEGGMRASGSERRAEKYGHNHGEHLGAAHRPTTVSATLPLRAGSVPSGIVSARAT